MDFHYIFNSKNSNQTQELGANLAGIMLKQGTVSMPVCLYGDLGSGKTNFAQGFAKGLGIKTRILSPTFIIVRRYEIPGKNFSLAHIDAYRIKRVEFHQKVQIQEILNNNHNLCLIEWADKIKEILPKKRIDICFKIESDDIHNIQIKSNIALKLKAKTICTSKILQKQ